ncbi:hypothetical protein TRFO_14164 [Tritrichomonas foetus]|uniref:Uncharacterized protein n=1 Tax=Tritrichomonas foetus TaxID=1144522 RepID=A0A1J4L0L0_9EUKA|nr:hypothetical protein TRFO_14164 [Tritrichomonas foetus]|eukprot:OHT15397.1 hypothetical protein TRFO_14164 [Tritrichomonas foetus]
MNVDYHSTREAFLEVSNQLEEVKRIVSIFQQAESKFAHVDDTRALGQNIEKLNDHIDQNADDFSTELRELRAYFSFQIKELNSKVDNNLSHVIEEISRPISSAPTPTLPGDAASSTMMDPTLRADIDNLKQRFESLLAALSRPETGRFDEEEEEEEEAEDNEEKNVNENINQPEEKNAPASAEKPSPSVPKKTNSTPASVRKEPSPALPSPPKQSEDESNTSKTEETSSTLNSPTVRPRPLQSSPKSNLKKIIDMRLDDFKIQIDRINEKLKKYDDTLVPLQPVVQKNTADIDLLRPDLLKTKADVIFLKGDMERVKDSQANSVVDFMKELNEKAAKTQAPAMPDIEKPLLAMRHQFMQQFAKMENAFNEQLKKMRAELISLKTLTHEIKNLPPPTPPNEEEPPISVTQEFAGEEPAEVALLREMQRIAEEERIKHQEELARLAKEAEERASREAARAKEEREKEIEEMKQKEEEKFLLESSRVIESLNKETSYETAEVQTDFDESSMIRRDHYTEVTNLPNHMIVSVIMDSPPKQKPIKTEKKIEEKVDKDTSNDDESQKTTEQPLSVRSTTSYEYSHLTVPDDEELNHVKKDIQKHQEIIERIVEQIAETSQQVIEVPPLKSKPKKESVPSSELQAIKDACTGHAKSIESLEETMKELQQNIIFLNQQKNQEAFSQKPPEPQEITLQPKQIILTPVLFTPMYIQPLEVHKITPNPKPKPKPKPKTDKPKPKPKRQKKPIETTPAKEAPAPANKKHEPETTENVSDKETTEQIQEEEEIKETQNEEHKEIDETQENTHEEEEQNDNDENLSDYETYEISEQNSPKSSHNHSRHRSGSTSHRSSHHQRHRSGSTSQRSPHRKGEEETTEQPNQENDPNASNTTGPTSPKTTDDLTSRSMNENEEEETQSEPKIPLVTEKSEFFSAAESSVGSETYTQETKISSYTEEDEEEYYEMDPMIKERFEQLSEMMISHQDQIKNIREGLVDLRTNLQILKSEKKNSVSYLPQIEVIDDSNKNGDKSIDDNAIRALRRRMDAQTRELEEEIYKMKKEILEIRHEQSKQPQTITERIIQVPFQNPNPPTRPASNTNTEVIESPKVDKSKNPIFDEENKVLQIKPLHLPDLTEEKKKVPKLPIVDAPLTPDGRSINKKDSKLSAQPNQIATHTQPSTPKNDKLPPILPPTSPVDISSANTSATYAVNTTGDQSRPFFHNVVHQKIDELNVLNATDQIDEHILNLIIEVRAQLMQQIGNNTKRLGDIESKIDNFVDKDYVQKFFQKMRAIINEINSNVESMKTTMPDRVTKDEMQNVVEELYHALTADQETSGATQSYRCLLCGRPKTAISGMIRDFKVAEALGQPTQTTVAQSPNAGPRGTLIYGPDKQMYRGKGNFGRPTIATVDSKKTLPKMK